MDETLQANGLPPVIDSQTHNCVKVRVSFQNHNIKFHFTKNFNQIFFECRMKQQLHGEATALLVFFLPAGSKGLQITQGRGYSHIHCLEFLAIFFNILAYV